MVQRMGGEQALSSILWIVDGSPVGDQLIVNLSSVISQDTGLMSRNPRRSDHPYHLTQLPGECVRTGEQAVPVPKSYRS